MKHRMIIMWRLLMGLMLLCLISGAIAEEISVSDTEAIRFVVQSQLDAFAEDDAAKAFALTTSSTRSHLGTPDNFLDLVKKKYPAIYRHRRALFSMPEMVDGQAFQAVRLTDNDNFVWLAIYQMQKEFDGNWKIEDCRLLATASISI